MDRRAFLWSWLFVPTTNRQSAQATVILTQVPSDVGLVELHAGVENGHATELRVVVDRTHTMSVALTDPTAVKAKPTKKPAKKNEDEYIEVPGVGMVKRYR